MSSNQSDKADTGTQPKRPLRIALVSARYYPYMGGTETHVHEVSRRMSARGHSVTILTTDVSGKLPSEESSADVFIRRFQAYPRGIDLYFAPALYKAVRDGQWDVVHLQGYHTFVAPITMIAAKRAKVPYVVTFHSGGHSSHIRHLMRQLQVTMLHPLLVGASQLIGVSEFEANLFSQRLHVPRNRFTVIPNGAQLPSSVEITPTDSGPLILSVGRLERYKGHHRIIRAMPTIRKGFPTARLRIAGSGPYEAELCELVQKLGLQDCVEIASIPPAERGAMATLMSQAALVMLFSEYEAHPVAVMEAIALKRPVLVAHTSGLAELADRGMAVSIPLESSTGQLAAAVIQQLKDPVYSSAESDIDFPTWDVCTDKLINVYRSVSSHRSV